MSSRKLRTIPDHFYHVYNRGLDGGDIFFTNRNYMYCLKPAKRFSLRYSMNILAYCLMPNHYHFLIQQREDIPISKFINVLFNAYVQAVNRQQDRKGTLFEGRVKYVLVDKEEYLIHLCRYIHLNPLRAGLVQDPGDWPYSNYLEWISERGGSIFDKRFAGERFKASSEYQKFVEEFAGKDDDIRNINAYVWD